MHCNTLSSERLHLVPEHNQVLPPTRYAMDVPSSQPLRTIMYLHTPYERKNAERISLGRGIMYPSAFAILAESEESFFYVLIIDARVHRTTRMEIASVTFLFGHWGRDVGLGW